MIYTEDTFTLDIFRRCIECQVLPWNTLALFGIFGSRVRRPFHAFAEPHSRGFGPVLWKSSVNGKIRFKKYSTLRTGEQNMSSI